MKRIIIVAVIVATILGCRNDDGSPNNVRSKGRLLITYEGSVGNSSPYIIRDSATGTEYLFADGFHAPAITPITAQRARKVE